MLTINEHAEFGGGYEPKLMRINGDFIDKVHERDIERARREGEKLATCKECGKGFEPNYREQRYCSRPCACRANARKAQKARRAG